MKLSNKMVKTKMSTKLIKMTMKMILSPLVRLIYSNSTRPKSMLIM